jgi:predicted transcriptional regulator
MMAPNYTARRSAFAKQIGPGRKASKEESVVKEKKGKRARG